MRKIEVPACIRGLIFDCDGTLVDPIPLHMKRWEYAITSRQGKWEPEFFVAKKGCRKEKSPPFTTGITPPRSTRMKPAMLT